MKGKPSHAGTVVLIVLVISIAPDGRRARAQIIGSAHDFSGAGWARGEICRACHTPHNADLLLEAPLWNHATSSATYTLYASTTLKQAAVQPGDASKACLCCHDGTVALDSFGGTAGGVFMTGPANVATDLSNDHPVGMTWEHQTLGGAANCSTCHNFHPPAGWRPPVVLFGPVGSKKVECPSCHTPHGVGVPKLLRSTNVQSRMCLACHQDK